MKTLIAEDELTSRLLLQSLLSKYGECHVAVNGKQAHESFQTARGRGAPYDLICLDIMMPEMDGRQALRAIREEEAAAGIISTGAKVIMTTAVGDMENVSGAFQDFCDAYLTKPIHPQKLVQQLKHLRLI